MSLPLPTATSSSLPLSVHLLAPRGGSAAMVAAAVWRWRWQIGGSVAGREAAAQHWRQLFFSLAVAVEVQPALALAIATAPPATFHTESAAGVLPIACRN
jgi:hypothetical protein